jgi:hypothetical protein
MITAPDNNMSIKYFDTPEYVQKSKKIKDQGDLAEHQAKQIESALETAVQYVKTDYTQQIETLRNEVHNQDLASKGDLFTVRNELKAEITVARNELKTDIETVRTELKTDIASVRTELKGDIKDLRYDTLKFIVWTGVSVVVSVGGMLMGILGAMAHGFHWI